MLTRFWTWAVIAATLATAAWPASGMLQIVTTATICTAALVAALQAGGMGRYLWLAAFVAVATLFNPVVDVPLPRTATLVLTMGSVALLVGWLAMLERTLPTPSVSKVLYGPKANDVMPR